MKNKFVDICLSSTAIFTLGILEILLNYMKTNDLKVLYSGIIMMATGVIFLAFGIISYLKYNTNKKQNDKKLMGEYDERAQLIDGKVAHFTIRVLIIVIFLIMFLSKFIIIPTNNALFIIILTYMITSVSTKKYYDLYF